MGTGWGMFYNGLICKGEGYFGAEASVGEDLVVVELSMEVIENYTGRNRFVCENKWKNLRTSQKHKYYLILILCLFCTVQIIYILIAYPFTIYFQ